jgi:hypothetical protein
MIIGISGRIGSGKDTVGQIIQYLLYVEDRTKVGVIPHYNLKSFFHAPIQTSWQIKKFAGKLKQIASLLTGVPIHKWEDQDFKNQDMPSEWDYLKQTFECDEKSRDGFDVMPMTYRKFLQRLGTEAIRDGLHPNAWVNALFADYKANNLLHNISSEGRVPLVFPNWIITDMRFPNEYEAVKSRGGLCVRVHRLTDIVRGELNGISTVSFTEVGQPPAHSSETALDSHSFDWVLNNSETIDDLVEEVRKMLIHFKLLEK